MKTDPRTLVQEVDKTPAPDLWSEIRGRRPGPHPPGPSNRSRLAAGAVALVVAGAALTFGYQALRPADERQQVAPAPQGVPAGDPRVALTIPLDPNEMAGGIAAADGSVWVGVQREDGSSPQVLRIDQATNEVVARVDVRAIPWRGKIAVSGSGVWIASDELLQRIDPVTYDITTVATLPGRTITALTADDDAVWAVVVGDSGSTNDVNAWVLHVDLGANSATTQIPLYSRAVGYDDEIALSDGSVWVSGKELRSDDTEGGGPIVRIDATTNEVLSTWDVNAFDFVVAGDVVLVRTARDGVFDNHPRPEQWQIDRYDADTGERISQASRVNDGDLNGSLGADQSIMWGADYDNTENVRIVRSNVETLAVEARSEPIPSHFHDAALDPESDTVWVSAISDIVRVDIGEGDTLGPDAVVPAKPGESTHLLSDFKIRYPYVNPVGDIDSDAAGVGYVSEWATDLNPGTTTCSLQVLAADGAVVGDVTFQLTNNVRGPTRWGPSLGVPVSAKPISAQGYCSAADPDQARAGYEVTDLRIEDEHLYGSVAWVDSIDPLEQFCQATFQRSDGTSKVVPFTLMVPEGDQAILSVGAGAADELTPEGVSCEPFAGQPDLTDKINGIKDESQS